MTIEEPLSQETSFLQTQASSIYYNAPIPFKHWQLRSLLCSPSPNILYYPTDSKVFSLNTETRERKLIAVLPFEPRCLGAKYGWICAGGVENGQFAAIRVGDQSSINAESAKANQRPLAAVCENPVDLSIYVDESGLVHFLSENECAERNVEYVRIAELGGSIVNSITLHKPASTKSDEDVVAVITNNDQSVRIFSLSQFEILTTLRLSFATNHASISPDGRHLVVVGDSPKVHFYHPSPNSLASEDNLPGLPYSPTTCSNWVMSSHPPFSTSNGTEALISTSFSPSSTLCAVASQEGTITIFDTRKFSRDVRHDVRHSGSKSPVLEVILSSRPKTQVGAVRSVQFSPSPWDLLVWAEHTGRVSIVDVRSGFYKRQVIEVELEGENIIEREILGLFEDAEDAAADSPTIEDPRHHSHHDIDEEGHDGHSGSAEAEDEAYFRYRSVRAVQQRPASIVSSERSSPAESIAIPVNPSSSETAPSTIPFFQPAQAFTGPPVTTANGPSSSVAISSASSVPASSAILTPASALTPAHSGSTSASALTPNLTRESSRSGTLPPSSSFLQREYLERTRRRNGELSRRREVAPTAGESSNSDDYPYQWHLVSTRSGNEGASGSAQHERNGNQNDSRSTRTARHRLARYEYVRRGPLLERSSASRSSHSQRDGRVHSVTVHESSSDLHGDEVDITGCTLSCDGKKLYVATTAGIVEYSIDLTSRKVFPITCPR